jgi:hypothetical protein
MAMNATAAALLTLLACPAAALAAGPSHTLNGLFCNTEAQIEAALQMLDDGTSPAMALAAINVDAQVCTLADRIAYVIEAPVTLGRTGAGTFHKYSARLVAVQVGGSLRPLEPPATVFFFRDHPIEGAGAQT